MTKDEPIIDRLSNFISNYDITNIYMSVVSYTELMRTPSPLFEPITSAGLLQSGLYGYFLQVPIYVTRHMPDGIIATCQFNNEKKYHSLTEPAIRYDNGHCEYYIDGIKYSFEEWNRRKKLQVFK